MARAERGDGLTRRITSDLKEQIASGVYAPGDRLPSSRSLAAELGVARGTVTSAYEQLQAEGYLEMRQGARARVAAGLLPAPSLERPTPAAPAPRLSAYGRRLGALPAQLARAEKLSVDLRYGELSAADFPTLPWKRALDAAVLRRRETLAYGDAAGLPRLRSALQAYLWRARGLRCEAERIIVVNGSQQGVDLCARLLVDPGDAVVIENPSYPMARNVFLAAGARLTPIPADEDGLCVHALADVAEARLAFVTPSHQFPLGGVLPAARRQALLSWAAETGAWILEDDYDGEFRYDAAPIPALQALSEDDQVLYLGTVSKTLSPQLRLGHLVVPPALAEAFAAAKRLVDRHAPTLEQEALAELIESGAYERHIRRLRRRNAERRGALLDAVSERLASRARTIGSAAGLHVILWLEELPAARETELIAAAASAGLGVYGVAPLYSTENASARPDRAGLILGYAARNPNELRRGVGILAESLDRLLEGA